MIRVLLDIDVVLDVMASREPFVRDAEAILRHVEAGTIEGLVAAHTITTLHYLLAKHLGRAKVTRVLNDLLHVVTVVSVDEDRVRHALALNWTDFEDALQAACAEKAEVDYLVTRDKKGFKKSPVRTVTPAELLALIS